MAENTATHVQPSEGLKKLDRLIGTWKVSDPNGTDLSGTITYEWMEGRFFLLQQVDLTHFGNRNKGMEIIGHEKLFGAEAPSEDIKSRFYGSAGETFDYVYEMNGDTLMIWGGQKGSPAYFEGKLSDNDTKLAGSWHWPGGGYDSVAIRVK